MVIPQLTKSPQAQPSATAACARLDHTTLEHAGGFSCHTPRSSANFHDSGCGRVRRASYGVPAIWTLLADQDCSSGRFDPGGPPCPEPQVQVGLGIMLVIAVVVLALAALWWWGMKRRFREGRKLLPQVWLLLIGASVLTLAVVTLLLVLP